MPEFSLKDQEGNWFHSREQLGKKPLVLFFYPKDFTPGCTAEACAFRDSYEDFIDAGTLVVGISSDSESSHRKFANRHRLPFILLSDPNKEVRRKFGVKNRLLNLLPVPAQAWVHLVPVERKERLLWFQKKERGFLQQQSAALQLHFWQV